MGWFDDSDSEDEKSKKKRARNKLLSLDDFNTTSTATSISTKDDLNEKDKEQVEMVDPLDAFMTGIQKSTSTANTKMNRQEGKKNNDEEEDRTEREEDSLDAYMASLSNNKQQKSQRRTRLDVENEEEATSHWKVSSSSSSNDDQKNPRLLPIAPTKDNNNKEVGSVQKYFPSSIESMHAKADMASIFHKAGDAQSKQSLRGPSSASTGGGDYYKNNLYNDNDEEDIDTEAAKRLKRTIDPLEKVNHKGKHYHPFRKSFVTADGGEIIKHGNSGSGGSRSGRVDNEFGMNWRRKNHVSCTMDVDPILKFTTYGQQANVTTTIGAAQTNNDGGLFCKEVLDYLAKNNYHDATLVQAQSIPVALSGRDLLVTSHTGSGKTLAYVLPLITHILDQPHIQPGIDGPIAIILTPTRELARQVHLVTKKIIRVVGGTAVAVTGGTGFYEMSKELKKGCEVIVSTPGRFIDMVKRKATNCDRVTLVILDEADKMLDMGFEAQVGSILENVRPDRQTWMFSATFGKKVERVANGWLNDPVRIAVGRTGTSSEHVDQHVFVLPSRDDKKRWMVEMLPVLADLGRMIIFVASRVDCEEITQLIRNSPVMKEKNLLVDSIHGDKHQSDRNAALSALRKGKLAALVATDVAARGLDVADIMTVVNFDAAKNLDSHVHRCGRAGRLSKETSNTGDHEHKKGNAYTLLTTKNADFANLLVEAFQREGREVNEELEQLARKSRYHGGDGRQKWNRTGLGFKDTGETQVVTSALQQRKRSRWGA